MLSFCCLFFCDGRLCFRSPPNHARPIHHSHHSSLSLPSVNLSEVNLHHRHPAHTYSVVRSYYRERCQGQALRSQTTRQRKVIEEKAGLKTKLCCCCTGTFIHCSREMAKRKRKWKYSLYCCTVKSCVRRPVWLILRRRTLFFFFISIIMIFFLLLLQLPPYSLE